MRKNEKLTATVFQFYIPEIRKYAFCKFFDFTEISGFHGLLAQVFDYFSDSSENDLINLGDKDYLFGPKSMYKWPSPRKIYGWKKLGVLVSPTDNMIPDFKSAQFSHINVEDQSKIDPWYPIHNLTKRGPDCNYSAVKHLELKILTAAEYGLAWRTGMEYCRINGIDIASLYDLSDLGVRNMYYQMINIPIYKDIPKEIRGKALL